MTKFFEQNSESWNCRPVSFWIQFQLKGFWQNWDNSCALKHFSSCRNIWVNNVEKSFLLFSTNTELAGGGERVPLQRNKGWLLKNEFTRQTCRSNCCKCFEWKCFSSSEEKTEAAADGVACFSIARIYINHSTWGWSSQLGSIKGIFKEYTRIY